MKRLLELLIVLIAATWPTFWFADTIDGDEFLKSGAGAASVAAIYALWKRKETL